MTDEDLSKFVQRAEEAADAWVRGDLDRYLDLVHHARGFTLLAPDGGPASQHQDRAGELSTWTSSFTDGEATLEHVAAHTWDDTVVLSMIERQHGRIGGQPDPGHVGPGHPRLPPRRIQLAAGASARRSSGRDA